MRYKRGSWIRLIECGCKLELISSNKHGQEYRAREAHICKKCKVEHPGLERNDISEISFSGAALLPGITIKVRKLKT